MEAITYAYKNKGFKDNVHHPIIKATGIELVKGVDAGFGIIKGIDYDSPDFAMREYLKRNVWKFSVAKNYNDCIRLSNLLVRKDGSLKPWNEFKKEALFVVGESNRYLKTEYDTIVAGAQMSRMWQEIQRDKHIFPYVQLDVVQDGRTSDICAPLHKLIFRVDDPVLAYYFPPNHFNCRTTARKLRSGVPSENYQLPDIPEAFKNNTGKSGLIFTDENRYIANTPKEVFKKFDRAQMKEKDNQLINWWVNNYGGKNRVTTITQPQFDTEVRLSKSNISHLLNHISEVNNKDIIKDLPAVLKEVKLIYSEDLDISKPNKNIGKKIARGVISYNYYEGRWRGLDFILNMEVMKNGYEQPYAIIFIKK